MDVRNSAWDLDVAEALGRLRDDTPNGPLMLSREPDLHLPKMETTACRVWFNKSLSSIHGILIQLRDGLGGNLVLIGSHTRADFGPLVECDIVEMEPEGLASTAYVDWCLAFCSRHRVQVFVPGRRREYIADERAAFEALGTRLIVAGDGETLRLLEDKGRFLECVPSGVRVHRFQRVRTWAEFEAACAALEEAGLAVCFKPAVGIFGVGFHILDEGMTPLKRLLRSEPHRISKGELRGVLEAAGSFPELLVMEYLDGAELSVDVLAEEGEVKGMVCRRKPFHGARRVSGTSRLEVADEGLSQVMMREPEVEAMVRVLVKYFRLGGLLNVQFRSRAEVPERPCLLEINGRMSGGLPYVALSGVNLPLLAVRAALRGPGVAWPEMAVPRLPMRVQERSQVYEVRERVTCPNTEWSDMNEAGIEARLPGGRFHFVMNRQELPLRELCDVALRNNSRRRFLFVSKVLGRHWPVRPAALRDVARRLAQQVALRLPEGPVIFIGMAETATTLGQAVFREWLLLGGCGLYIESTRRRTGGAVAFEFAETHSHATAHAIHLPGVDEDAHGWFRSAGQVVIVDDEVTTGNTAAALAEEFRRWRGGEGAAPVAVTLAVLLSWQDRGEAMPQGLVGIESLAAGAFEFQARGDFAPAPAAQHALDSRVQVRRGVRHGSMREEELPAHWKTTGQAGERVLIIGQGEHGFLPLRLAERLEEQGASAWVLASTRSPILLGGAIRHVRCFPALSGEGHDEHLYNVPEDHDYDRVLLCMEDARPAVDHPIWSVPRLEVLV
jgi:hypothetical protein